ncbi:phosphatidate cytidylyltransferase [Agrococcus sp. ARC_14]|uniref:phosphatidate cytidylyltransferase n=1 Tax=Agrococcus sp. ARC_14 TaxID=2919927 RepID=UPI001F05E787|nr:phosphatidate cytidylyltransferase [Agrococcus sp. ARC_14]MCH1882775.1 phosphatidate cytidylyltransferase [Agrococcus sp. ARC_14]
MRREHRSAAEIEAQIQAQIHAARDQIEATRERVNKRTGRNIVAAFGIALVLVAAVLVSLLWIKTLFMVFATVLIGFALFELASALRFAGRDVPRVPLVLLGCAIVPVTWYFGAAGMWWSTLAAIGIVALVRLVELADVSTRTGAGSVFADVTAGALCIAYVAVLGGFTVLLAAQDGGQWWALAMILMTTVIDTGALAVGVWLGRHKLAPRISPGKTWEGLLGGAAFAIAAGIPLSVWMLGQEWWFGIILAVLLVTSATVGDLAESIIKRDLGIKDIGSFLPGHGGFLDRLDSILPSAVVMMALFQVTHA